VDWAEIRSRVDALDRALSGASEGQPERIRAVLEERARALARSAAAPTTADRLEAVTFALGGERYAIEARYVIEVFRLKQLSALPGAERPVFGVTAWRGELLTLCDLRGALGLSATALNDLSLVLVLGEDRAAFGILADAVHGLVSLSAAQVREPSEGTGAKREYVRGLTPDAMLVLDAKQILHVLHT